jgi:hypothetical protein
MSQLEVQLANPAEVRKTSILDDLPRGQALYEVSIRDKVTQTKAHSLGAFTIESRQEWYRKLNAVIESAATEEFPPFEDFQLPVNTEQASASTSAS